MKRIEFGEFKNSPEIEKGVLEVLRSNWISGGPVVKEAEEKWAKLFGYKKTVLVSSGTAGCTIACLALYDLGAKEGDEVIVPALSFIATSNAVRSAGLKPVWVDVKTETLNIDEEKIETAITEKTRALMVVNTMGRPCEMDRIAEIAKKHNLILIVDNCEAYGSKFKDQYMLAYGDMEITSSYTAHLIQAGEMGSVSTNNDKLADILTSIRSHGRPPNSLYFDHIRWGVNAKTTDLHAAVAIPSIERFWDIFNKRHANMRGIREGLRGYESVFWFSEEDSNRGCVNAPHGMSLTVKPEYKEAFKYITAALDQENIHWKRNFGCIPTQHRAFASYGHKLGDFPNSEYIGNYGLHFGTHEYLTGEDITRIIETITAFVSEIL